MAVRRQRILLAELPEPRRVGQLRIDHRQVDGAEHDVRQQRRRHVYLRRVRPAVARNIRRVLRHHRCYGLWWTLPQRHSRAQLQHLEYRHRFYLQGLHARSALLRHEPLEGQL